MPRPLRLTTFFTAGNTGWTETHYDTLAPSLASAVAAYTNIVVPRRMAMLAAGPWLQFIRASYDDTFRDSQVFELPPPNKINGIYYSNPTWKTVIAGVAWTAALCRGQSGDLYRKQVYLSGGPFSDDYLGNPPNADPAFTQAFAAWASALVSGQYGFPVWQRDVQTFPIKTIVNIGPAPTYTLTIPNHGFTTGPGKKVYLSKMTWLAAAGIARWKANGPYPIVSIPSADTVVLGNFQIPLGVVWISGFAQFQQKTVVPYTSMVLEGFTHRKRGRPFDSPRGRSRRRTTLQIA